MATPGLGPRGFVPSGPDAGHGGNLGPAPAVGLVAPLLGEILIARCGVTPDAIERALGKQREEGGLLGEILLHL